MSTTSGLWALEILWEILPIIIAYVLGLILGSFVTVKFMKGRKLYEKLKQKYEKNGELEEWEKEILGE